MQWECFGKGRGRVLDYTFPRRGGDGRFLKVLWEIGREYVGNELEFFRADFTHAMEEVG